MNLLKKKDIVDLMDRMSVVISPSAAKLRCLLSAIGRYEPAIVMIIKERLAASHGCEFNRDNPIYSWTYIACPFPCMTKLGTDEYFLLLSWDNLENPRCSLHICPCIKGDYDKEEVCNSCYNSGCNHPYHADCWCTCPWSTY